MRSANFIAVINAVTNDCVNQVVANVRKADRCTLTGCMRLWGYLLHSKQLAGSKLVGGYDMLHHAIAPTSHSGTGRKWQSLPAFVVREPREQGCQEQCLSLFLTLAS
jgi:hypothetical protein